METAADQRGNCIIGESRVRPEPCGVLGGADGLPGGEQGCQLAGLPAFLVYAGIVYQLFDLYKGKWRFASLPDLSNIFRAVSVLALSLLVLDYILVAPNFLGTFFFGKITIVLYWLLQIAFSILQRL